MLKIAAVVVSYNPQPDSLLALVAALSAQVVEVVVVDNGSRSSIAAMVAGLATCVELHGNKGIAAAQNSGVRHALEHGAEAVVFFDQDSQVPPDIVARLADMLKDAGVNLSAPVFADSRYGFYYPIVHINSHGLRTKHHPRDLAGPVDVSTVISSGTMVRCDVFQEVGMFDEGLFIDYVDTEWCLRCAAAGHLVRVNPKAVMQHALGESMRRFGRLNVPVHSPHRRYYRVRNALLLARMPHVPFLLWTSEVLRGAIHQLVLIFFEARRIDYFRYYVRGLIDGFRGRSGPLEGR